MHSQLLPTVAGFEEGTCLPVDKRVDFPPKKIINLDLGIGSSADAGERGVKRNKKIKQENRESLFTAAQLLEFYNQILVYNLITLGLPVAFHLLLPTWLGVLKSFGPAIYKKYPILADLSLHKSDCSNVMDPEPGRCRRTDGRKWRCSKNVVPQQKYCERHMHRGRQGSRKHVECIKTASRPDITTSDRNKMPTASIVTPDIDDRVIRSSIQSDHSPSPSCHNGIPAILNCRGDESCDTNRITVDAFTVGDEVKKNVGVDCYTASNMSSTNEKNHAELNTRKTDGWRQSVARNSYEGFVSSGFGLSPTSVLPCAAGKVSPGLGKKSAVEAEPQRCRRTDGKKWQCRRDTLPNQKYCEAHMHRGAKKIVLTPQSMSGSPARKAHTRRVIPANLDNGINLNTVPTSPQHSASENNSTSSMSDATTITDENISRCLKHSPQN